MTTQMKPTNTPQLSERVSEFMRELNLKRVRSKKRVKRTPERKSKCSAAGKIRVTLLLDHDVVEKFRATGRGWQSRMNEALKSAVPVQTSTIATNSAEDSKSSLSDSWEPTDLEVGDVNEDD